MSDPRIEKVAKLVTNYSINVKPGEKVLIHCSIDSVPMVKALIREIYAAGGYPFVNYVNEALSSEISAGTDKIHLENMARYNAYKHFDMDAVIYLNVPRNQHENSVIS